MTTVTLNTVTRKVEVFSSARDVQARAYGHDSKPALEAVNVPPGIDHVFLRGYAAAGDGGAAHYRRVATEPGHPGKIQSNDGAWWEIDEARLNVKMFGAGTAAFQAAIDTLPGNGGIITVLPDDYSTVTPASLTTGGKVVTWEADRGVTLPADMPGAVVSQGRFAIGDWSGNTDRNGDVFHHVDLGDKSTALTERDRAFHVTGTLPDNGGVNTDRVMAAYSFNLQTTHNAVEGGNIRGLFGVAAGDGGQANVRAIRVIAEGKNGHTGSLTGILATVVHTDSANDVNASIPRAIGVASEVGAGCTANFQAGAFNGPQRPSFGYIISTSAGQPLRPEVACFYAHASGNGDLFAAQRGVDSEPNASDIVFAVDNKARITARSFYSGRATLADDTAIAIDNPSNYDTGFIRFWVVSAATQFGEGFYRTVAGPNMAQVFSGGAEIAFATGILTGTTGADAKLTVSAHTDNKIYIENRLGLSRIVAWAFTAAALRTGNLT